MRAVTMELRGRLGNQLFCWATAKAISISRKQDVVFSFRFADPHRDILTFDTQIKIAEPGRVLMAYQNSKSLEWIRNTVGFRAVVQESGHRFDEGVLRVKSGQTLRGHFQSPKYFDTYRSELTAELASLRSPSREFLSLFEELSSCEWLAVQVRGGDYFQHQDKFVIVGAEYYSTAVERARSVGLSRIVVFTDDLEHAQRMVPGADSFIVGGVDLSPGESLLTSQTASMLIGTNSSFSWWTGYLMKEQTPKVFPRSWFKHPKLSEDDLFPRDFLLLDN